MKKIILLLMISILLAIPFTIAQPLNFTLVGVLENSSVFAGGLASMHFSTEYDDVIYGTSSSGDGFYILNISDPTTVTIISNLTKSANPNSLNGAGEVLVIESQDRVFVAASQDDTVTSINITDIENPTFLTSISNSAEPYSLDNNKDFAYFQEDGTDYLFVASAQDDVITVLNVTDYTSFTNYSNFTSSDNPCSIDGTAPYGLEFDEARKLLFVSANSDDTVTVLNVTDPSDILCVHNYTVVDPPGSSDSSDFLYDDASQLLYLIGNADADFTILNYSDPFQPLLLDSVNDSDIYVLDAAASLTLASKDGEEFAFVALNGYFDFQGRGITVINITDKENIAVLDWENETSGDCVLQSLNSIINNGTHLFAGSNGGGNEEKNACFYSYVMFSDAVGASDVTPPTWDEAPYNITIGNSSGLTIQYNATDETALDIYFTESTVGNFSLNITGWLLNATYPLPVFNYSFNISVNDSSNNILRSEIYVDVYDDTVPDVTSPTWDEIPSNTTIGNDEVYSLQLNASDDRNIDEFYINSTTIFQINSSGYLDNKTSLPVGNHTILIYVNDTSNNTASTSLYVDVYDNIDPVWSQIPYTFSVSLDQDNYTSWSVKWNATDETGIDFYFLTDEENFTMTTAGLMGNLSHVVDIYTVFVNVFDTSGNIINHPFYVNITAYNDTTPPTWTQTPYNISITNETALSTQYNATDEYSGIDVYFVNDEENFSMSTSGLLTNNTLLSAGNYTLNISVNDTRTNILRSEIYIDVYDDSPDTENPVFTVFPSNVTLEYPSNITAIIDATDNVAVDDIYLDDTENFSLFGNPSLFVLFFNNTLLDLGTYNVIVSVNDTSNNTISATFQAIIQDTTPPTWSETPYNISVNNETAVLTDWNATDNYSLDTWYVNDEENFSINNSGYFINNTNLGIGNYSVNVSVNDSSNNILSKIIGVEINNVADVTAPAGGGGGGELTVPGPNTIAETAFDEPILSEFCGDDFCQDKENPLTCWGDCKITYDSVLECGEEEEVECIWKQKWFPSAMLIILLIGGFLVIYTYEVRSSTEEKGNI